MSLDRPMLIPEGYDLRRLLIMSGAVERGSRRFDCPDCKSHRGVSVNYSRGVFHCFSCEFKGNDRTLAKRLGLDPGRTIPDEVKRIREQAAVEQSIRRDRIRAVVLNQRGKSLERRGHAAGPASETSWGLLEQGYRMQAKAQERLDVLEDVERRIRAH